MLAEKNLLLLVLQYLLVLDTASSGLWSPLENFLDSSANTVLRMMCPESDDFSSYVDDFSSGCLDKSDNIPFFIFPSLTQDFKSLKCICDDVLIKIKLSSSLLSYQVGLK